jgi:tRNA 2-thiouridine synthesizing protein A
VPLPDSGTPMSNVTQSNPLLDVSGLLCPLPFLMARKRLQEMAPGATLHVVGTGPDLGEQLAELCSAGNHVLIVDDSSDGVHAFRIKKCTHILKTQSTDGS